MEEEVIEMLRKFYDSIDVLLSKSKDFLNDYKLYDENKRKDVRSLKERMKEQVIKGTYEYFIKKYCIR